MVVELVYFEVGVEFGDYVIEEKIGEGGFSVVYCVCSCDVMVDCKVVIKILCEVLLMEEVVSCF